MFYTGSRMFLTYFRNSCCNVSVWLIGAVSLSEVIYSTCINLEVMSDLNIYFGGSISGGREYVNRYEVFCDHLQQYGDILTEHVADPSLDSTGEDLSKKEVYERDMRLLDEADLFIADVSTPSLGVGYEVRYAEGKDIPSVVLYHEGSDHSLSGLIRGNPDVDVLRYNESDDIFDEIDSFVSEVQDK